MVERSPILFRAATSDDDARLVYRWRTDPRTMRFFFDRTVIPLEAHLAWFRRVLTDPNEFVLLASVAAQPIGVVRCSVFAENGQTFAQVGPYLDPDLQGQGLGSRMLSAFAQMWCPAQLPHVHTLIAKIAADNQRSQICFARAGFTATPLQVWGMHCIRAVARLVMLPPADAQAQIARACPPDQVCDHTVYVVRK